MSVPRFVLCLGLALLCGGIIAPGVEGGWFSKPRYGTPWEEFDRAGRPNCVSWLAIPNYEKYDHGYYVGGGAPMPLGEPGYSDEGIWGWDYMHPLSRVQLNWYHGRRYQMGDQQYETDRENNPTDHFYGRYRPSRFSLFGK